jgi:hypothetical protein
MEKNDAILTAARQCYDRAALQRAKRDRYKKFTYGNQWGDVVTCPESGERVTEGELASRNGRMPLTNNLIRRLVKTVVGHFRTQIADAKPDRALADVYALNQLDELDARMLEEFLISGCAIQRIATENRPLGGKGIWVDNVSPANFFCSTFADPRCHDLELVGMLHDWSVAETVGRFAGGDRARAADIRRHYSALQAEQQARIFPRLAEPGGLEFGFSAPGRCRVVEVWTLDATEQLRCHDPLNAGYFTAGVEREAELADRNRRRARRKLPRISMRYEFTTAWHGRFLSPMGMELAHVTAERHPFVLKMYPLVDGEVHSFVEDVIDQQKYVNRLITLIDNMMSSSAKGVLLFPEDEISDQLSWEDVRHLWASYDGVMPYRPRPGSQGPRQVVTNPTNCGAHELLSLEMKLFENVTGVNGVLQGDGTGGNSAQLYEAQTRNATAAMADIFATFNAFRSARDEALRSSFAVLQ